MDKEEERATRTSAAPSTVDPAFSDSATSAGSRRDRVCLVTERVPVGARCPVRREIKSSIRQPESQSESTA